MSKPWALPCISRALRDTRIQAVYLTQDEILRAQRIQTLSRQRNCCMIIKRLLFPLTVA